jgi:hypothetical protein
MVFFGSESFLFGERVEHFGFGVVRGGVADLIASGYSDGHILLLLLYYLFII